MMPAERIVQRIEQLAQCTDEPLRLTRLPYSPAMEAAHALVRDWMEAAGLEVHVDAIGNLVGRRAGTIIPQKTLLLGSHLDTVRDAGKFDGALGVILALACAGARRQLPFTIEVIGFIDEEGVRFQTTYLGSRALAGTLTDHDLLARDRDDISVASALRAAGGAPERIALERRDAASLIGYVEAHIEQGPVLETEDRAVGVVSAIAGQSRIRTTFTGVAGHAGTVPMGLRRDALCAAAEFTLAVESIARESLDLVATVGQLTAKPGASNVIPGVVELTIDVRHQDDAVRGRAVTQLEAVAKEIATRRSLTSGWEIVQATPAVRCDRALSARLRRAIGPQAVLLASGAGHDAAALAGLCPVAMLFIRCLRGISHHPDEFASEADIAVALEVLLRFVDDLAAFYA